MKNKIIIGVVLFFLGIVAFSSADPLENLKLISQGQYQTDLFSGAATYSYPLIVPPGVNGLEPKLFVSYNHHATNSQPTLFGNSWNLNHNRIIRHTSHTRSNTADDYHILQLDGLSSKLVYVASEGRYHTEIESYLHIKKKTGGNNQKKEYWEVKKKDGTTYRFGYNQD